MAPEQFLTYRRSSTSKQTVGLEIQDRAIDEAMRRRQGEVVASYQEVARASPSLARLAIAQPQLDCAIAHARRIGATLVVARVDRLTRSTAVMAVLIVSELSLLVVDMPSAGPFLLQLAAGVAEEWRRQVSRRCKTAIAVARAKDATRDRHCHANGQRMWARAKAHAESVCSVIEDIRRGRSMSTDDVATELNARGIRTVSGKPWKGSNIRTAWRWRHQKWSTRRFPGAFPVGQRMRSLQRSVTSRRFARSSTPIVFRALLPPLRSWLVSTPVALQLRPD
jgi:DNA invertase Pin-like site-specific DNA recombinase